MNTIDSSIPLGVRTPNLGNLVDSYQASKANALAFKASKQDLANKKALAGYAANADKINISQETRAQDEWTQRLTDLATGRKEKREQRMHQTLGEEAEVMAGLPPEQRSVYYESHLIPHLKDEGFDTQGMPEYSDSFINSWRQNAMTPGERSTERTANLKASTVKPVLKINEDGTYTPIDPNTGLAMDSGLPVKAPPQLAVTQGPNGPITVEIPRAGGTATGTPITNPQGTPVGQKLIQVPEKIKEILRDNGNQLAILKNIKTSLSAAPGAAHTGPGYGLAAKAPFGVGDIIANTVDPEGTQARQLIAQLGSLKIKSISGAAVNASEWPRLQPWIPTITDSPEIRDKKVENFELELARINQEIAQQYTEKQGYRVDPLVNPTHPEYNPTAPVKQWKKGDTRTNTHGDPMIFDGTKWNLADSTGGK